MVEVASKGNSSDYDLRRVQWQPNKGDNGSRIRVVEKK